MTKYKLLRDLPSYKAGTIFEKTKLQWRRCSTDDIDYSPTDMMCALLDGAEGFTDWFAPVKEEWPQDGDNFYFVDVVGAICSEEFDYGVRDNIYYKVSGNYYRTREEAQHHKLRQESMAARWKPEVSGEEYFYFDIDEGMARNTPWTQVAFDIAMYNTGNIHPTREAAEEWGKRFAPSFNVLLNS